MAGDRGHLGLPPPAVRRLGRRRGRRTDRELAGAGRHQRGRRQWPGELQRSSDLPRRRRLQLPRGAGQPARAGRDERRRWRRPRRDGAGDHRHQRSERHHRQHQRDPGLHCQRGRRLRVPPRRRPVGRVHLPGYLCRPRGGAPQLPGPCRRRGRQHRREPGDVDVDRRHLGAHRARLPRPGGRGHPRRLPLCQLRHHDHAARRRHPARGEPAALRRPGTGWTRAEGHAAPLRHQRLGVRAGGLRRRERLGRDHRDLGGTAHSGSAARSPTPRRSRPAPGWSST